MTTSSTAVSNSVIAPPLRKTEAISKRKRKALGSDDDDEEEEEDEDLTAPGIDSNMSLPRLHRP
jgi:hypothetical protein